MNILVCIKQVPGSSKVEVDAETGVLKRAGVVAKMNPYDLYAVETALQLKERLAAKVSVITMGPPQAEAVLREAYMMGADEAALISDAAFAGADVLATAYTLSQGIGRLGRFDLIICGKQTTDGDTAQVGPELAEFLGLPHISNVSELLQADEQGLELRVDFPESLLSLSAVYPCLITVEKGINSPRLPSYRRKLLTKDWPIRQLALQDMADTDPSHYGLLGSPTQVERIFPPEAKAQRELWHGQAEDLAQRLLGTLRQRKIID